MEITKALRETDAIVVCLSKRSITKEGFVQKEIRFALDRATEMPEGTIFIIPARIEECEVPSSLKQWHWLDLFGERGGGERLLRGLSARAEKLGLKIPRAPLVGSRVAQPSKPVNPSSASSIAAQEKEPAQPPTPRSSQYQVWAGIEFASVPGGNFIMGSRLTDKYSHESETPKHLVSIEQDYWIGRFPITNGQFSEFVGWTHHSFKWASGWKKKLDHPVIHVSWDDAVAYVNWLNNIYGKELPPRMAFSLPSEAEWEKAARGTDGRAFPWGSDFDSTRCKVKGWLDGETTSVGLYSPRGDSPYGVSDMAGGVWEWTRSGHHPYPYRPSDGRENLYGYRELVIVRGGPYEGNEASVRVTRRYISSTAPSRRLIGRDYDWVESKSFTLPRPQGLRVAVIRLN